MRTYLRGKITLLFLTCAGLLAIPAVALADDVYNNLDASIDATAESITLTEGGTHDTASLLISPTDGDGKNGCNLTGSTTLQVAAATANNTGPAKVAVSLLDPTTGAAKDTFVSCGDSIKVKVEALAATTTPVTVSLTEVSNTTGRTFNLAPATFTVTVNSAVTATSVSNITASASTFGGTTDLSAKVSPSGAPGSVAFFVNGSSTAASGTVNYDSSTGVATLSNYSHGLDASATPYSVKAVFTPSGSSYSSSDATNASALTVGKATTTTTVSCTGGPFTYTGSAITPCSANVTGPGGLNAAVTPVTYSDNVDAGTATASASYGGTANYNGSNDSETFAIGKASSTTMVTCPANVTYTGSAITPCTASVTGAGGLNQSLTVNYTNNTDSGTATASASYAGDANHNGSSDSKNFNINFNFTGFASPVDNNNVLNTAKAGQAIPLKWRLTDASGNPVTNLLSTDVKVTATSLACSLGLTDDLEVYATGSSGLQNLGNGYYQFNWSTPKSYANSCKTMTLSLGEGTTTHTALFQFTR